MQRQMRVRFDQARHQRAATGIDNSGAATCPQTFANLLDQIAFDQHILTHGQLVVIAIKDADVFEQHLFWRFFFCCRRACRKGSKGN